MARRIAERADDSVLYLYAVTKSGAGDPPQLRSVDGQARIEAIACAGLTCWISRVSSSEFGESFSKRLEDLDWLAVVSVRHQRAVAAIAESRDTLPARLGTVFLSEASLGRHPQAKSSSGRGFAPHCGNARVGYQGLRITSTCSLAGKSPDGKGIPS